MTAAARVVYENEQLEGAWSLEQSMRARRPEDRDMVGGFVWMGADDLVDGRRLHLSKRTYTRRYLRLDAEGTIRRNARFRSASVAIAEQTRARGVGVLPEV